MPRNGEAKMIGLKNEPEIVMKNGKPTAVILKIKDYEELLEKAEDAEDLKYLRKLRSKPMKFRKLDDFLAGTRGRV